MIVLGVDPGSLRTGYGVIGTDGRRHHLVEMGVITPAARGSLPEKLRHIHASVSALIERHSPDALAVEDVFHAANTRTALVLGHASSNAVSSNDLLRNSAGHGAVLSAASAKNKMYRNRADNNEGFGFLDSSLGRGTAGTANTYTTNICSGNNDGGAQSSPAGLCR